MAITPNSELLGDTARTSQTSPLSAVTVTPVAASRRPEATSVTSAQHLLRHRDAGAPSAAAGRLARAGEQHDLALHDGGEVVFDRGMDVGHVERHRQPAREGVEVAQVDLALARHLQLPLEPGGELAHHHRDEDEQDEIDDFLRVRDAEAVERRIEEEGGGEHAADRGNHRGHDAPARGRDHHRDQIDHRAVAEPDLPRRARQSTAVKTRDQARASAQCRAIPCGCGRISGRRAWSCRSAAGFRRTAQYTPRDPCLSLGPLG